jgi:predicted XRE-type DNA-binding protein
MKTNTFSSVWDAIEDTPGEAENMRLRARLMMDIEEHVKSIGITQSDAAKLLGVTQPRVSDLMRGKIHRFTLESLINMAAMAGMKIEMRVKKAA